MPVAKCCARLAAFAVLVGCSAGPRGAPPATAEAGPRVVYIAPASDSLLLDSASIADAYRLRPDRRVLLAIAEIHHLATGTLPGAVTATRTADHWQITYADSAIGELPDLPTYDQVMAFLSGWTRRLTLGRFAPAATQADSASYIARFIADDDMAELTRIDAAWSATKNIDPRLARRAATALTALLAVSVDQTGIADPLAGRAIAAAVVADVGGAKNPRDEALLAVLLGYEGPARRIAAGLPSDDAVAAFVDDDRAALNALAMAGKADGQSRFLAMLAAAGTHDDSVWLDTRRRMHASPAQAPALAATALALELFHANYEVPGVIESAEMTALASDAPLERLGDWARSAIARASRGPLRLVTPAAARRLDWMRPASVLARVDAASARRAVRMRGPFLDPGAFETYHRALLQTAYVTMGLFLLEDLASIDDATAFAAKYRAAHARPADAALGTWYDHLAALKAGTIHPLVLQRDPGQLADLDGRLLMHTFAALTDRVSLLTPEVQSLVRTMTRSLDSRPAHQRSFAALARGALYDPQLIERHAASLADAGSSDAIELASWLARVQGAPEALWHIATDSSAPLGARRDAFSRLSEDPRTSYDSLRSALVALIADEPRDWSSRQLLIDLLRKRNRQAEVSAVAADYLRVAEDKADLGYIAAHRAIARSLLARGRTQAAWDRIEPMVGTFQAGAMITGIEVLLALGRVDEAMTIADAAVERYPDGDNVRAWRMGTWWRSGQLDRVREELHAHLGVIHEPALASAFIAAFATLPDADRAVALTDLAQNRIPALTTLSFAENLADAGEPEVALALLTQLSEPRPAQGMYLALRAHRLVEMARGEDAALEWLMARMPMGLDPMTSALIYAEGKESLLWTLPISGTEGLDWVWFMRAAAATRSGLAQSPYRAQLEQRYAAPGTDRYHQMGRYLLGLEPLATMRALSDTKRHQCEVAYYIAVRAMADGRVPDAIRWFRAAVETQSTSDGEYTWALLSLKRIMSDGANASLERLM
jgi:tetratricopeptide (TPR) repeat protein